MSHLAFIDAHHHLWDLNVCHYPWLMARGERRFFGDPSPIQKNYLAADFLSESARYRPLGSVHIQVGVQEEHAVRESTWLQSQPDYPSAIVAFADLSRPDVEELLDAQLQHSKLRGIRQIVGRHIEEDRGHGSDALLENPAWLRGLQQLASRGLSFDLQLIPPQVPAVLKLLRQLPELKVVLCHCGSPWDQSKEGLENWRAGLKTLAKLPNVSCKVSGLGMFNPGWSAEDLRPIILDVIEIFGTERVMFGSNFPVDKLYRSYEQLWTAYTDITHNFSNAERQQLFIQTAADFYRISQGQV